MLNRYMSDFISNRVYIFKNFVQFTFNINLQNDQNKMGRKFIPAEVSQKSRKIFLDDLRKIHKRRVKMPPVLPKFE